MKVGHNFHHRNKVLHHISPQSRTNQSANGTAIVEPWLTATEVTFVLSQGALAATVDGAAIIEGRKRSDTSWVQLKQKDGTTNLAFTATLLDDVAGDNTTVIGTIPLEDVDSETYDAIRLTYTESGNAAALVSCIAILSGFREQPSGQTDDLFSKVHNVTD